MSSCLLTKRTGAHSAQKNYAQIKLRIGVPMHRASIHPLVMKSAIARKMIFCILLFSSVITLLSTLVQLHMDYRRDIDLIEDSIRQIKETRLESITRSVWDMNLEVVRIQLEGILKLRDMQYMEIRKDDEILASAGQPGTTYMMRYEFPIVYIYRGVAYNLGTLHITVSLEGVYRRLTEKITVILISQTVKTFLVSLFIFFLFYGLVGRHLRIMGEYVREMDWENLDSPLVLKRKGKEDELDALTDSFNKMRGNLKNAFDKIRRMNAQLAESNESLRAEIRERERAEKALQEKQHFVRRIIDSVPGIVYIYDLSENCNVYSNSGLSRVLGYSLERLRELGSGIFPELLHPDDFQQIADHHRLLGNARDGEILNTEYRMKHADGNWRTLHSWNVVFARDEKGTAIQIAGTAIDITERKQAEENILQLNRELTEKNRELEQIVQMASHDLRSPLVNVQGFGKELQRTVGELFHQIRQSADMQTLREKTDSFYQPDIQESLEYIFKSASKMDMLLSGLLRLSRLGRAAMNIRKISMNTMLADILKTFEYRIKQMGAQVELEDLPDCFGDETMLSQVFSNLIDNALKFSHPDKKCLIRISGIAKKSENVYCVEDRGIGIAKAYHSRIFEIFSRLDTKVPGEGLGLSIIRRILEKHGGSIRVESEPGTGSCFYVSLPDRDKGSGTF
ncbi:MAG: ATP-binding protein [Desulfobacterales bacterium]